MRLSVMPRAAVAGLISVAATLALTLTACSWCAVAVHIQAVPLAWQGLEREFADRAGKWRRGGVAGPGDYLLLPLSRHQHAPLLATPYAPRL